LRSKCCKKTYRETRLGAADWFYQSEQESMTLTRGEKVDKLQFP